MRTQRSWCVSRLKDVLAGSRTVFKQRYESVTNLQGAMLAPGSRLRAPLSPPEQRRQTSPPAHPSPRPRSASRQSTPPTLSSTPALAFVSGSPFRHDALRRECSDLECRPEAYMRLLAPRRLSAWHGGRSTGMDASTTTAGLTLLNDVERKDTRVEGIPTEGFP